MIINYPDYYPKFKCIAGKCPDTCCAKWEIVVDEDTSKFYNSLNTIFGQRLKAAMFTDKDGDVVFKNRDNRCPFLNSKNLCDIYINIGEERLCNTCKMFPRFKTTFGGTCEQGLSLSCPEAAELIIGADDFTLITDYDHSPPDINELDADLFLSLKAVRKKIMKYIDGDVLSHKMLSHLLSYGYKLQREIDSKNFESLQNMEIGSSDNSVNFLKIDKGIFGRFEYLTEYGKEVFSKYNSELELKFSNELKNILRYYIYRYFLKSVYDNDPLSSVALAVFGTEVICNLTDSANMTLEKTAVLFSKEIEHSQHNLNSIKEYYKK